MIHFKEKYGPLALIAGASEGIGEAFAHALAGEGLNLILVARRREKLESLARELTAQYQIDVQVICCDLSDSSATEIIGNAIGSRTVNFLVYNAAFSRIGPFLDHSISDLMKTTEVNMLTPLKMTHYFGKRMVKEQRGGIVLMSSIAGNQGSGFLAAYAATKAFNRILAESLWYEWKDKGVDVIGCCAGATLTPNYLQSNPKKISLLAPKPQLPEQVVRECFSKIGRCPSFISGRSNKIACFLMDHIFSVKKSVNTMGNTTGKMYGVQ
jgi:uncharacterized protein